MKNCSRCGAPMPDGAGFCGNCGETMSDTGSVIRVATGNQSAGLGMKFKVIAGAVLAVLLVTGGFLSWSSFSSEARFEKKLELAVKYLSENKYEEAILAYNEAIKIDPKNMDARVGLAQAYIGIGYFTKAEAAVKTAQDIGSINPEQYQKLIEAYIEQKKFPEAERLLTEARDKYTDNSILDDTEKLLRQEKAKAETVKPPTQAEPVPASVAEPPAQPVPKPIAAPGGITEQEALALLKSLPEVKGIGNDSSTMLEAGGTGTNKRGEIFYYWRTLAVGEFNASTMERYSVKASTGEIYKEDVLNATHWKYINGDWVNSSDPVYSWEG